MKKLMVLATVAMTGLYALADAQIYEMQLTMKTTESKSGKVNFVSCDCGEDSLGDMYRKQATNVKIKGVIWGCDCETIGKPSISTNGSFLAEKPYGYIFWNEKTRKPMNLKFKWEFLNRIDKTAKKTEGTWTLTSADGNFMLMGSGFGTVKDTTQRQPICMRLATWVPKMNGNFAGWSTTGAIVTAKATDSECTWCDQIEGTEEQTASAPGWSLCRCSDSDARTAAMGTWMLKYNATASKKLMKATKVTEAYAFPAYVKSVIE